MHPTTILDTLEDRERLREAMRNRGMNDFHAFDLAYGTRTAWRHATHDLHEARATKNRLSREFGERKKNNEPVDDLTDAIADISDKILKLEEAVAEGEAIVFDALSRLPNIPEEDDTVPIGDETANRVVHVSSTELREFEYTPKDHVELGTRMGCMSFENAANMSGSRFVILTGALAKMERVLGNWMLDNAVARGYEETSVPHLVRKNAMFGTGQLPKFEDDLFKAGEHYLIPTGEVPLTNIVRDTILEQETAIWRMRKTALTPCYRAEAGSAGRDTRGLLRMHQFNKVELVSICSDAAAYTEIRNMLDVAKEVLATLGLPYRVVLLSTGDMGFSARKTYDLEVWVPSENKYREISSISNCGEFQARRMNARWKLKGQKGTSFVHTLNGSGVAVGRALLAIMENYQTIQGGIAIPPVLRGAMGGSFITPTGEII